MKIFKQIIIITLIVVCVIALEIITNTITEKSISDISQKLEKIEKNIDENPQKLNEEVDKLEKDWKEKEEQLSYYLEHDESPQIGIVPYAPTAQAKIIPLHGKLFYHF